MATAIGGNLARFNTFVNTTPLARLSVNANGQRIPFQQFLGQQVVSQLGNTIIPRTRVNSAALAHNDPETYLDRVNREHEDIYDAIARRDPESARAAMRMHLSNSRERLRRAQEAADKATQTA